LLCNESTRFAEVGDKDGYEVLVIYITLGDYHQYLDDCARALCSDRNRRNYEQ
jgi:hypothetical protein